MNVVGTLPTVVVAVATLLAVCDSPWSDVIDTTTVIGLLVVGVSRMNGSTVAPAAIVPIGQRDDTR